MSRPAFSPGLALALGVFAVSWSSILVRFCETPFLVIAFYRLGFSTLFLLPLLAASRHRQPLRPGNQTRLLVAASGLLLALHFAAWISSLTFTTIASSVVLVSTQSVFAAFFSRVALGERAPGGFYVGVAICLAGSILIAGGDLAVSRHRLAGDLLALLGAAAAAGYFVIGRSIRAQVPFLQYLVLVNGSAALFLGMLAAATGQPLLGTRRTDFLWLLMMALGPSLAGHTCFNWAVRHLEVFYVNLAAFGEPILASCYAFFLFGEKPLLSLWGGAILVVAGILKALPRRKDGQPAS